MNFLSNLTNRVASLVKGNQLTGGNMNEITRINSAANAMNYFDGLAPLALNVKAGAPDDNVHINYAETIVSKKTAFLFGEPLKISVGTDADKRGEEYLETVWPEAQRSEDFTDMATDGAISGDAYLKISIGTNGQPRVTVGDPNVFTVETDPHDISRVTCFRCQYEVMDESTGKPYTYKEESTPAEDGKSWLIREYHSFDGGRTFSMTSDVTAKFQPVYHCKNLPKSKSFNGRADLRADVLRLISAIARLDSLCAKTVRVHSSPKPYATGLRKQDMEMSTENVMFLPGGTNGIEAKVGLLEMRGDLQGALSLRKVLREGLSEMTKVPEIATGKVESTGQLSGVALRILYSPLLDETKVKQRLYGRMIKDVATTLIAIGNVAGVVTLHWADPLPVDEVTQLNAAEAKLRVGFSQDTIISQLGGDAEAEREKRQLDSASMASQMLEAFDKGASDPAVMVN